MFKNGSIATNVRCRCITQTASPLTKQPRLNDSYWKEKHDRLDREQAEADQYWRLKYAIVDKENGDDADVADDVVQVHPLTPATLEQRRLRLDEQLRMLAPVMSSVRSRLRSERDDFDDFDDELSDLNFTAIAWEIDNELEQVNDRKGRSRGARGLPSFLGNAVRLFDIKTVIKEIETSVMTSVSCSACKAGDSVRSTRLIMEIK